MTNNPTIDGVSRATIEKALSDAEATRARTSPHIAELRALLDAPADVVIALDAMDWATIQGAAAESKWFPPEYMRNDWVSDVCEFLRNGAPAVERQEPVGYLDIGTGGYLDIGSDLTDEQLLELPKGRHSLVIAGTFGVDGYVDLQSTIAQLEDKLNKAIDLDFQRREMITQLQARIAEFKDGIDKHWKVVCDQRSHIAELESGRGEPVAWRAQCVHPRVGKQSALFDKKNQAENWATHWRDACGLESSLEPLYTAPPAPVGAVLPERKPGIVDTDSHEEGWNACLDATAALNTPK